MDDCKAECGLCSGAVLNDHKALHCDNCGIWVHNDCSLHMLCEDAIEELY